MILYKINTKVTLANNKCKKFYFKTGSPECTDVLYKKTGPGMHIMQVFAGPVKVVIRKQNST